MARILIVEDNDSIRWTLTALLRSNGYDVEQTSDAHQALRSFAAKPTDVVLLDVYLPAASGLEICRRLRKASRVPIVMISAYDDPTIEKKASDCGASLFLTQPFEFDDLLTQVRVLSERDSSTPPPPPAGSGPLPPPRSGRLPGTPGRIPPRADLGAAWALA